MCSVHSSLRKVLGAVAAPRTPAHSEFRFFPLQGWASGSYSQVPCPPTFKDQVSLLCFCFVCLLLKQRLPSIELPLYSLTYPQTLPVSQGIDRSHPKAGLLSSAPLKLWARSFFIDGALPELHGVCTAPQPQPTRCQGQGTPLPRVVTTHNVSSHCHMSPEGQELPLQESCKAAHPL